MSALKIFHPAVDAAVEDTVVREAPASESESDGPVILSFAAWVDRLRGAPSGVAERSRQIHDNWCCPRCDHAAVMPLMLNDGRLDSAGQVVPGTATLVGFRCSDCEHEWPVTSSGSRPYAS